MTMDSWGGEDSAALFAQQEEEARLAREREAAYQAGPLPPPPPTTGQPAGNFFGQQFQQPPPPVGDLMAPLMPPAPPPTMGGINPNQGGFRGPENPANLEPGPNADMGIFTPFHPLNEALFNQQSGVLTPYVEPARNALGDIGQALGNYAPEAQGLNFLADQVGTPNAGDVMRVVAEGIVGNSIEEYLLNSLGGGGITGYDDLLRAGMGARGAAADVFRAAMPEPNISGTGLNIGVGGPMDFRQEVNRALNNEAANRLTVVPGAEDIGNNLMPLRTPEEELASRGRLSSYLETAPTEELRTYLATADNDIANLQDSLDSFSRGGGLTPDVQVRLDRDIPDATPEEITTYLRAELIAQEGAAAHWRDTLAERFGYPTEQGGIRFASPPEGRTGGLDPYDTGQQFGYNPGQPNYQGLPARAVPEPPSLNDQLRASLEAQGVPAPPVEPSVSLYTGPDTPPRTATLGELSVSDWTNSGAMKQLPEPWQQQYDALVDRYHQASNMRGAVGEMQAGRDLQTAYRGSLPAIPENLPAPPDIYGRTFYDQPEVGPARLGVPENALQRADRLAAEADAADGPEAFRMLNDQADAAKAEAARVQAADPAVAAAQARADAAAAQLDSMQQRQAAGAVVGQGEANAAGKEMGDAMAGLQDARDAHNAVQRGATPPSTDPFARPDVAGSLEQRMAGGGTPPAPTAAEAGLAPPASPPPASLSDAEINAMQESVRGAAPGDMVTLYRGDSAEATASMGQRGIDTGSSLASDPETAMLFARRIDPENPRVTEFQVPRSQVSEKEFYFTANEPLFPGAAQATPSPPAGAGAHWFDDPRFPLIDEADPPPMTFQQLLENSRNGAPPPGAAVPPPAGASPPAGGTPPPPPGGPPGAAAAGPTGAREEYFARLRAERDASAGGTPPPPGGAVPPGGTPPANPIAAAGPPPSVAANPQAASLWDNVMDLLYGPLQMDVGTPFRQNLSATLDLSKIGRTREVLGDAVLAASGRAEAVRVMRDLDQMVADAAKSIGHQKPNLHLPDIPGVKVTRGNVGREVNQSNLFGQIPGIGAAYNVTGRANAMVLYSQRARDYVDFVKNLPDRAFATKDASKWAAQAQYFADQRAVTSGRGSFGSGALERVLAHAGPAFTSLRYLLSLPERVPYLIPINRVAAGQWEVFGPAWREAAKEHAFFGAALAGTYAAADKAGLSIRDKDGDITGKIKAGPVSFDLTGGASQYWNTIQKMADGDMMAGAEFLRNKSGPGLQAIAQGLKLAGVEGKAIDFMRPDWFDQGATGSGMANRSGKGTDLDRAAALILPLWMQSTAKAYRAAEMSGKNPYNAAAAAGTADFLGVNTRANPMNTRTPALNSAMADPANLKGLPPNVVEFLTGKDWTAATPDEQRAIRANLSPEKLAEVEKGEQQLRDRNDIFQAGRDQSKAIADAAAAKRAELAPVADRLLTDFNAGKDVSKTVAQMKQIEKAADEAANKVYQGTQRIYDSKEYQDKIKDFPDKGAAQKEVDQIRELSKQYNDLYNDKRVVKADGSRDYDKLGAMQAAMLDVIRKDDPGFATRLEFNLQPNPANSFELTHQIKAIETSLDKKGYYDVPTGSKTQYAREHPDVDALLSWLYGNPVHSQQAAQILQSLAPQRTVQYAR